MRPTDPTSTPEPGKKLRKATQVPASKAARIAFTSDATRSIAQRVRLNDPLAVGVKSSRGPVAAYPLLAQSPTWHMENNLHIQRLGPGRMVPAGAFKFMQPLSESRKCQAPARGHRNPKTRIIGKGTLPNRPAKDPLKNPTPRKLPSLNVEGCVKRRRKNRRMTTVTPNPRQNLRHFCRPISHRWLSARQGPSWAKSLFGFNHVPPRQAAHSYRSVPAESAGRAGCLPSSPRE